VTIYRPALTFSAIFFFAITLGLTTARAADDATQSAFKTNCVTCHGPDGSGSRIGKSLKVADFHSDDVKKKTDAQLIQSVTEGKNNMPPFKNTLTADQIKSLIGYVRELGKAKAAVK